MFHMVDISDVYIFVYFIANIYNRRKSSFLKITFNFKLEFQLRKIRFGAVSIQFKVMLNKI